MEKLQFYANMPFMLYVPYYILFVQENTSKDQEINKNAKSARLNEQVPESTRSARLQLA